MWGLCFLHPWHLGGAMWQALAHRKREELKPFPAKVVKMGIFCLLPSCRYSKGFRYQVLGPWCTKNAYNWQEVIPIRLSHWFLSIKTTIASIEFFYRSVCSCSNYHHVITHCLSLVPRLLVPRSGFPHTCPLNFSQTALDSSPWQLEGFLYFLHMFIVTRPGTGFP